MKDRNLQMVMFAVVSRGFGQTGVVYTLTLQDMGGEGRMAQHSDDLWDVGAVVVVFDPLR